MRKLILLLQLLGLSAYTYAQNTTATGQSKTVDRFVESYNQQNFKAMRKTFSPLMKLFLTKSALKNNFSFQYRLKGKARMAGLKSVSAHAVSFEMVYERDTTESQKMGFAFNKKNKIRGMSIRSDKPRFQKSSRTSSISEEKLKSRLDSVLGLKSKAAHFSGCIAVVENGKTVYKNCAGYSNAENKLPLNDSSLFELASCSKQFTAISILMLMEQGKLQLSDEVRKFIPDLPYGPITVEQLLTHSSGLPDYEDLLDKHWDKNKFATNADVLASLKKHKPKQQFKPGKKYEYSNTGYVMLSLIIEKVSGKTYAEFLSEHIFGPLGMRRSRVYNTRRVKQEKISNYAYGYVYSDSLKKYMLPDELPDYAYVKWLDGITGDGTVNSTITDLLLWEKALRENRLIQKNTLEKAFTPHVLAKGEETDYGYGWFLQKGGNYENLAYHTGGWPGYVTLLIHFIDRERSVILLSNNEYPNFLKFGNKIVDILNGKR